MDKIIFAPDAGCIAVYVVGQAFHREVTDLIDLKQELQNYPYIDLKSIEENSALPDNIKNSIILYNKALESLKFDSEDIAIIELKKAVAMNPNFHEAINLLGLCYCYIRDYSKAAELFNRVIAAENNSIAALRYLNSISPGSGVPAPSSVKKSAGDKKARAAADEAKSSQRLSGNLVKSRKPDIVKFAAGCVVGALAILIIWILVMPGKNAGAQDSNNAPDKTADDRISQYETQYNKLNEDYQKLKQDLDSSNAEVDYYKSVMKLFDVEKLASEKKYEEAADMLVLLKAIDFRESEKAKYDSLYNDIMPVTAQTLYLSGTNLYNTRQYDEALKKFEKLQSYNVEFQNAPAALYIMGRCYTAVKDSRSAVETFQKLKDKYPKSSYALWADGRIKELTAIP